MKKVSKPFFIDTFRRTDNEWGVYCRTKTNRKGLFRLCSICYRFSVAVNTAKQYAKENPNRDYVVLGANGEISPLLASYRLKL